VARVQRHANSRLGNLDAFQVGQAWQLDVRKAPMSARHLSLPGSQQHMRATIVSSPDRCRPAGVVALQNVFAGTDD